MKILLGVTGSVAAKLTPVMVKALTAAGHEVEVVATEPSIYFWKPEDVDVKVWRDKDEWIGSGYMKDQKIPHIDLRNWADMILIAPLTANTLAKLANGMADNLLTSVMRAWDIEKPVVVVPAMNTHMWEREITRDHLQMLKKWFKNYMMISPISKKLACGDTGMGAMATVSDIVSMINMVRSG